MKKIISVFLSLLMLLTMFSLSAVSSFAAETINSTLNMTRMKENQKGEGYFWDNIEDVFTMTNLSIVTTDDYGLKIPHGAVIELKGKNYIKASKVALGVQGDLTIKGSGTLTLVSDDIGIECYATTSTTLNIVSGTIKIETGNYGIKNEYGKITYLDGSLDIKTATPSTAFAISSHVAQLTGGTVKANAPIFGKIDLRFIDVTGNISTSASALQSDNEITVGQMKMQAGDSDSSLSTVDAYNGEACFVTKSAANHDKGSVILSAVGMNGSQSMDIVIILVAFVLLAVIIGAPVLKRYRRTEKLKKRLAEEAEGKK